ncbi:hypothetical protein RWH43_00830 [Microbacterium sp. KSW2-21]|uniref:Uncharacterized protein n=1 Tax=Microbacterium algihabitans TaxID=3075992 RepID=A0ABU3RQW1_9MICO|nr:hypothetical protein [Microbacterium sp. KSW2-21]MDU0325288.1 hypothetical protein [Microbacterium sp. KSW2-21]
MNRTRVEIDLNSLRPDGTTRVRLTRADGPLNVGQMVTAFESEDGVAALALVSRVDSATGSAFLIVNRESMRDDDGSLDRPALSYGANRAVAHVENVRAARSQASSHARFAFRATGTP